MCHDHGLPGRPRRTARPLKHTHEQGGETDRRGRGALQGRRSEWRIRSLFGSGNKSTLSRTSPWVDLPPPGCKKGERSIWQTDSGETDRRSPSPPKCEDSGAEDLHSEVATKSTYTHTSTLALTSNGEWLLCLQYIVSYPAPNQALASLNVHRFSHPPHADHMLPSLHLDAPIMGNIP